MAFAGGSPLFIALVAVLGFFLYAMRPVIQAWLLETTPKNMGGSSIGCCSARRRSAPRSARASPAWSADRQGLIATFYFLAATIVIANVFVIFIPKVSTER